MFSASPSKDIKNFFIKGLCCHIASYTIQLATTENPVSAHLASTVIKTHNEPVIAPFCVQPLKFFNHAGGVLVT